MIQDLADKQEITDLVSRLGAWLDGETTLEQARAILTEDVRVKSPGGEREGIERTVEQARRNHTDKTQHVITNVLIDLHGDTATAGANAIIRSANQTRTDRYAFETRRTPEGWRLTKIGMG